MKQTLLLLCVFLFGSTLRAQTNLLQDKSGQTSLMIDSKNNIAINTGSTSISAGVGYAHQDTVHTEKIFGGNIALKANNGIATVLSGTDFKPQVDLNLYWGSYLPCKKHSTFQFMYVSLTGSIVNYNLLKTDNSDAFNSDQFMGYNLSLGYNTTFAICKGVNDLFGISAGYAQINNLSDLKSATTYTTSSIPGSNNTQTTLLENQKSGYSGDFQSSNAVIVNFDEYVFPFRKLNQIGFGGYGRCQLSGFDPRTNAGGGIIFGRKGSPSLIVLGILYQFNDIFNQLNKQNDFLKRGGINLVAGYKF
jgi:hypothetical protein